LSTSISFLGKSLSTALAKATRREV
jgi:hypothetical protein